MRATKGPKLLEINGMKVYALGDLYAWLGRIGKQKEWNKWFHGQTGPMIDGKFYIYYDDVAQFISGKPPMVT